MGQSILKQGRIKKNIRTNTGQCALPDEMAQRRPLDRFGGAPPALVCFTLVGGRLRPVDASKGDARPLGANNSGLPAASNS